MWVFLLFSMSLDSVFLNWKSHNIQLDSALDDYIHSHSFYSSDYVTAIYMADIVQRYDSTNRKLIERTLYENYMGNCFEGISHDADLNVLGVICYLKKKKYDKAMRIYKAVKTKPQKCWIEYFIGEYLRNTFKDRAKEFFKKSILTCPDYTVAVFARDRLGELENGK